MKGFPRMPWKSSSLKQSLLLRLFALGSEAGPGESQSESDSPDESPLEWNPLLVQGTEKEVRL